jgi:hypothetical protein
MVLTMSAILVALPAANAAVIEIDTFMFVMLSPNPVGVDQRVQVSIQIDKVSPTSVGITGGDHFTGLTVEITKPDGTTEERGPYEATAMSGNFFIYTPSQVGTYSFQASFPGQWINTTTPDRQRWYKPSTSAVVTLDVQQEPIEAPVEDVPLPNDYWERPIYGENKGWWQIADNWPMRRYDRPSRFFSGDSTFAPYTSAPNSAHILWKKPIVFGGIGGGSFGDKTYYTGLSYEQFYTPIIINGRIYYVDHGPYSWGDAASGSIDDLGSMGFGTYCIDLYTGEEIWFLNNTNIIFAQIYNIENPNEHGLIAHLWEVIGPDDNGMSTWRMYDAFTGRYILTIENVPIEDWQTNSVVFGPSGELLSYVLDNERNRLILWNSTLALGGWPSDIYYPERYNLIEGAIVNGLRGIQWNVSIPDVTGNQDIQIISIEEGYILASWMSWEMADPFAALPSDFITYPAFLTEVAYPTTLEKLADGSYPNSINHLWVQNRTNIHGIVFYSRNIEDGVYTLYNSPLMELRGYDIKTGRELWVTGPITTSGWAYFTYMHHIAYGKLYTLGYDGHLRAWDIKDGKLVWDSYLGNAGYETPYGTWPSYTGPTIADGKIYITNDDHSPDSVPWRGGKLWCFDADDGELLWSISGWLRHSTIADGILTAHNSLDGQIYTFGKGPSETTVSAPDTAVPKGNSVLIKGSVLDMSPGQPGTPCISDNDMSAWMEYLHMQKQMPADAQGVTVKLEAVDPNGGYVDIGTATSDSYGNYGLAFEPDTEGTYMIIATFTGSGAYYGSTTTTYLAVGPAVSTDNGNGSTDNGDGAAPIITTEAAIILAIAIIAAIGIVAFLALRKQK